MLAITNGRIVTVCGDIIEKGVVLVDDGKIVAVGADVTIPEGAEIIDATGKWVTPGLIDCHTHISTFNEPRDFGSQCDGNEMTSPITAHIRGIDALNPHDSAIAAARSAGFTTCYTGPGSANLICGTGIAFKCKQGATVYDIAIPGTECMKMALGQNPISIRELNTAYPFTRMGNGGMLREALFNAQQYAINKQKHEAGELKDFKPDFKLEALYPLMTGRMKARIHCHRADDVVTATRIAKEFGFAYTIEHCTEGYRILDYLKDNDVTCVVGPLLMDPYKNELWDVRLTTPAEMEKKGINFCMTADTSSETKWLPVHVGIAMANGLSEKTAFECVTIRPARLLGLDDRMGTLEPGKDADIAIFDGHPFSNFTHCVATLIDGKVEYARN